MSKIEEFKIGIVVKTRDGRIGHVDGFSFNSVNELIVVVKFPVKTFQNYDISYKYSKFHPTNLEIL